MKYTRTRLEASTFITPNKAQDILNREFNHALARGKKVVRISRIFTDDKCRQRRIVDEVGIYEHS